MRKIHALLMLAGFGALNATPALAQLREGPYAYGGLSVGQSRAKVDENRIANSQLGLGLTTSSVTSDETDTAYRVFGGYQINRWVQRSCTDHSGYRPTDCLLSGIRTNCFRPTGAKR